MEAVVRYAAQTITLGLMQAPGVAKVLWPQGDEASQIYQISALDQQLSAIKQQMSDLLDRALFLIMDDLPTFVNFTAHGAFADSDKVLTLPNATNSLDLALKTYMTSESLRQNGFAASISRHSTPESMAKSLDSPTCSNIIGGILCGMTTDIRMRDQTNAIFWSESTHLEYVIYHHGSKWSYNIMSAINANGWADMLALFDGAYNCTMQGKLSLFLCVFLSPLTKELRKL